MLAIEPRIVRDEPGYFVSLLCIGLLVSLFVASLYRNSEVLWAGIFLPSLGLMFLASYFFDHKAFFLRGLMWICEHFSRPCSRNMAFFYFGICMMPGAVALIHTLKNW
nr:putative integron gene cassette protein [uncultured bacterium]CAS03050.1 putative integron gene cassette protein [uncultured bacterium]